MEKSKLVKTLNVLTEDELKAFRKWIFDKPAQKATDIARLFEYILAIPSPRVGVSIKKEVAFTALFPDIPYDDRIIRRLMSELFGYIKDFILLNIQKDDIQQEFLLADFYLERDVPSEYRIILRDIEKQINSIVDKQEIHLFHQYEWQNKKMLESTVLHTPQKEVSTQSILTSLDVFYIATALRWNCTLINNNSVATSDLQSPNISYILNLIKGNPTYLEVPLIALNYHTYNLLNEPDNTQHYDILEEWMRRHEEVIAKSDQSLVAKHLRNYCVRRINMKGSDFQEKYISLMELHLSKGFLFKLGKYIPEVLFNNMITIYLRAKKIESAKVFIGNYQQYLQPETKESVLSLAWIKIEFDEKQYKKAFSYIRTLTDFTEFLLQIDAKRIKAKVYFRVEEKELLIAHLDAMKMFIRREKEITDKRRASYQLFVKYMRKLATMNLFSKEQIEEVYNNAKDEKDFVEKEWILEILAEKMGR